MKLAEFKLWLDGYLHGLGGTIAHDVIMSKLATVQPEQVFTGGAIGGFPGQVSGGTMLFGSGQMLCDAVARPAFLNANDLVCNGHIKANKITIGRITIPVDITDEMRRLQNLAVDRVHPGSITAAAIRQLNARGGK